MQNANVQVGKEGNLIYDVAILLGKIVITLLIVILLINTADFLVLLVYAILFAFLFNMALKDAYTILHYQRAKRHVGRYLNKVKPKCPFLIITASGFNCQIEFSRKFSPKYDLPKCHEEKLFREHWIEKGPGLLEQAQKETNVLRLRSYLSALAFIGYKPASDLFLDIVTAPQLSILHNKLVALFSQSDSYSKEELFEKMNELIDIEAVKNPKLKEVDIESKLTKVLEHLEKVGLIHVSSAGKEIISITSMDDFVRGFKVLKARNNSVIRNVALVGLSKVKDERGLPVILNSLGKNPKNDAGLIEVIVNYGKVASEPLKELILEEKEKKSEKYLSAIEALGKLKLEENFDFLYDLWNQIDWNDAEQSDLEGSVILTAMANSSDQGLEIALEKIYTSDIDSLVYNSSRNIILEKYKLSVPILFEKLEKLPEGELTGEQEDVRQTTLIMLEDLELKKLKQVFNSFTEEQKEKYWKILTREGETTLARSLKEEK